MARLSQHARDRVHERIGKLNADALLNHLWKYARAACSKDFEDFKTGRVPGRDYRVIKRGDHVYMIVRNHLIFDLSPVAFVRLGAPRRSRRDARWKHLLLGRRVAESREPQQLGVGRRIVAEWEGGDRIAVGGERDRGVLLAHSLWQILVIEWLLRRSRHGHLGPFARVALTT